RRTLISFVRLNRRGYDSVHSSWRRHLAKPRLCVVVAVGIKWLPWTLILSIRRLRNVGHSGYPVKIGVACYNLGLMQSRGGKYDRVSHRKLEFDAEISCDQC